MRNPDKSTPETSLPEIPDKLYFRIGEVGQLAGVEAYVLRYWESEFPSLAPKKSGTGHRLYRRKDVEMVLELKRLLYEKRFTIEGARLYLEQNKKQAKAAAAKMPAKTAKAKEKQQGDLFASAGALPAEKLAEIKRELSELLSILG